MSVVKKTSKKFQPTSTSLKVNLIQLTCEREQKIVPELPTGVDTQYRRFFFLSRAGDKQHLFSSLQLFIVCISLQGKTVGHKPLILTTR